MPVGVDGKYFAPIQFHEVVDYILTFTISLNLVISLIGIVLITKHVKNLLAKRFFLFNFVLLLIWQISKICYFMFDTHPFWHFIYGFVAPLSSFLIILFQLELLRVFSVLGYKVNTKLLIFAAIANVLVYLATAGSGYMRLITIGQSPPLWVQNWYKIGYPLYFGVAILFGNFQLLFMLFYLKKHIAKQENAIAQDSVLFSMSVQSDSKGYELSMLKRLGFSIIYAIVSDYFAVIVWLSGWLFAKDDFGGQKIQVIGTDFGASHLLGLCICYFYTQRLFMKNPKQSNNVQQKVKKNALLSNREVELAATVRLK
jgi:hypothetical protein